jgi:hypothetical protein
MPESSANIFRIDSWFVGSDTGTPHWCFFIWSFRRGRDTCSLTRAAPCSSSTSVNSPQASIQRRHSSSRCLQNPRISPMFDAVAAPYSLGCGALTPKRAMAARFLRLPL